MRSIGVLRRRKFLQRERKNNAENRMKSSVDFRRKILKKKGFRGFSEVSSVEFRTCRRRWPNPIAKLNRSC